MKTKMSLQMMMNFYNKINKQIKIMTIIMKNIKLLKNIIGFHD